MEILGWELSLGADDSEGFELVLGDDEDKLGFELVLGADDSEGFELVLGAEDKLGRSYFSKLCGWWGGYSHRSTCVMHSMYIVVRPFHRYRS